MDTCPNTTPVNTAHFGRLRSSFDSIPDAPNFSRMVEKLANVVVGSRLALRKARGSEEQQQQQHLLHGPTSFRFPVAGPRLYRARLSTPLLDGFFSAFPIYRLAKFGNKRHQLRWILFLTSLFGNVQPIALWCHNAILPRLLIRLVGFNQRV
jgi:hypothetical protein